ncbi:hypothetical protein J4558_02125 [Leptolyngbya sp. 15MV]|nr:hypothetical protein J4558_02125 [Leptolyngbya sp. 15MV]
MRELRLRRAGRADLVDVELIDGRRFTLAIAADVTATARHRLSVDGQAFDWTGPVGRFDQPTTKD